MKSPIKGLHDELDQCMSSYNRTGRVSGVRNLYSAARLFSRMVCDVYGGYVELDRRAVFVEDQCAPSSKYDLAGTSALGITDVPDFVSSTTAFGELCRFHEQPGGPQWSGELTATMNRCRLVRRCFLLDDYENLCESAELFQKWIDVSSEIVKGATFLGADGCRMLMCIHCADLRPPPLILDGKDCESIKAASALLSQWVDSRTIGD